MASIQVLDSATIHDILINLSKEEAITFRDAMEKTLKEFSTGGEREYQPMPSVVNRANGQKSLFRPFTSDSGVGTKITVEPAPGADGQRDPLRGLIVLCDGKGNPAGMLSSEEVTGYRTSMNAMVPFSWRKYVDEIVVFGAGVQALWHTRLILTLRGSEVKAITFVSRRKAQTDQLVATVSGENRTRWKSRCDFRAVDPTAADFRPTLEACLASADCIFCTTPSTTPLFPAGYVSKERGSRRPFISAIGSWQADMIELDPAVLDLAVLEEDMGWNPVTGEDKGVVIVDDRDFALRNSGEIVQSKLAARDIVEAGEILALRLRKGISGPTATERIGKLNRFVSEGLVVYKSVGVSLTDLTFSEAILALARRREQHG